MNSDTGTAIAVAAFDGSDEVRAPASRPRPSGPAGLLTSVIRGYQLLRTGRPTGCRYHPTCSEYAIEAVELHGAASGAWLTTRRLLRCTPWGGQGFDPVPERRR